jgi:hypothetical protein
MRPILFIGNAKTTFAVTQVCVKMQLSSPAQQLRHTWPDCRRIRHFQGRKIFQDFPCFWATTFGIILST